MNTSEVTYSRPRFHWCGQYARPSELSHGTTQLAQLITSVHMFRDGGAGLLIYSILARDYDLGEIFLNLPADVYAPTGPPFSLFPELSPEDIIGLTTRPGLVEEPEMGKTWLNKSGSDLETMIHKALGRFFKWCSRQYVILSDEVAEKLDSANKSFRAIQFRVNRGAVYTRMANASSIYWLEKMGERIPGSRSTVGYVVYIPHLAEDYEKPSLLSVFGMDGPSTLLLAQWLHAERPELVRSMISLGQPRIVVCELHPEFSNDEVRPAALSRVEVGDVEVRIDIPLPGARNAISA